ncbi:iron-containing redox enzyme family protein [uncultured Brevundimonas sp.]|uniref:iron-containing redox enzyme family protein n=1 Tax=uncultured Brevundimonas sp. TaxID=213418 RepID=UPI0030EB1649|tara:strand:+ start:25094 stop:25819 length:726 start_codon:yes stop_codon:yes gene_type:complete
MNSTTEPPLDRGSFEQALLKAIAPWPLEGTRFYRALTTRRCPLSLLQRYARSTYLSATLFCATIAELVDKAPDREARLTLLENMLEEEGIHLNPRRGLIVRPEARHPALALRFLRATGVEDGTEEDAFGNAMHATGPGRAMLAEGRWLEAVAFLLIGQELKFATAAEPLLKALGQQGFSDRDLAFFAVHIEADAEHGQQALDLVLDRAVTAQAQQACIAAAETGAHHWFDSHGSAADRQSR